MKIFNRRIWKSFAVVIPVFSIFTFLTLFALDNNAESKAPVNREMVLTGELITPDNKKIYRYEDPERDVVCYAKYKDFSGCFSCVYVGKTDALK